MRLSAAFTVNGKEISFGDLPSPVDPNLLIPGHGPFEVEIGFGKGRYLLERAALFPQRRFLGVELVSKYYRLVGRRAHRRGLGNVAVARGEALYLLSAILPAGFARRVHVYFPDPWPKSRHRKRRLFDPESVDLVLGLLEPNGELFFATDFLEYGDSVAEILAGFPGLTVTRREGPWEDGVRTHYEAKYMREERPILRLRGELAEAGKLHPDGWRGILVATHSAGETETTAPARSPRDETAQTMNV